MRDRQHERKLNLTVLENMRRDGADLSRPLDIDFHINVPTGDIGEIVAAEARSRGFRVRMWLNEESRAWTVECTRNMVPDEPEISGIEELLDALAKPHGGKIDGWGSWQGSWPKN